VRYGNYINLPYHGKDRPILAMWKIVKIEDEAWHDYYTLESFLDAAEKNLNDPESWRVHGRLLLLKSPEERARETSDYGTQENLHICARAIIDSDQPITEGNRHVAYFRLACQMLNCVQYDGDEVREILTEVNKRSASDSLDVDELERIIGNAERGQYTSTGCDDPLFEPYAHPDCPIAHPRR